MCVCAHVLFDLICVAVIMQVHSRSIHRPSLGLPIWNFAGLFLLMILGSWCCGLYYLKSKLKDPKSPAKKHNHGRSTCVCSQLYYHWPVAPFKFLEAAFHRSVLILSQKWIHLGAL